MSGPTVTEPAPTRPVEAGVDPTGRFGACGESGIAGVVCLNDARPMRRVRALLTSATNTAGWKRLSSAVRDLGSGRRRSADRRGNTMLPASCPPGAQAEIDTAGNIVIRPWLSSPPLRRERCRRHTAAEGS